jgi:NDP-sugar pyrophosphorylase family protein
MSDVCAVILAAGEGQRLRPLTARVPKALCPVANVPLLDHALARVARLGFADPATVAVNASYLGDQVVAHVGGRAHVSAEDHPLGTSGGVGKLRTWIDGRGALVGNADAYLAGTGADPVALLDGWDGDTVRLFGQPAPGEPYGFAGHRFAGFSLLPWRYVRDLTPDPAELVRTVWRPAEAEGALEVVTFTGTYLDTGTPRDYLAANLHAAGDGDLIAAGARVTGPVERAVVGAGAVVEGALTRAVVWPGGYVGRHEHVVDAIRAGADLTVPASLR